MRTGSAQPGLPGLIGHPHRGEMVDVVGRLRIEVPDRVVAHGREVDHRIEAREVLALHISDIGPPRHDLVRSGGTGRRRGRCRARRLCGPPAGALGPERSRGSRCHR
jgi:hypothetical protein